ncbi:MAG: hypoxanthine-guanine phosphoribosyltransferase [Gammaproteobacteria bacterium]|nr:hypoxanthine-guanine phosphoribosyltransferase [Gammaproteobacteria bacterium]
MSVSPQHIQRVRDEADCLHNSADVDAALERMAVAITAEYRNQNPLLICVMNGGLIVTGGLMLRLDFPLEQDYLHATRYRGATQGGELHWAVEPKQVLKGRDVLIVDDILDEGYTLAAIVEHCQQAGVRSVKTVVLVEKLHSRKQGIEADFVGLQVPDRYVFGCGMDYKGFLRNANGIFAVRGM